MIRIRPRSPVDYRLCSQTVTIYHWDGKETYTRRVIEKGAFLDWRKNHNVEKTGSTEASAFLLVIPCSEILVAVNDKVYDGEGPKVTTREAWAEFIPAKVPGLVVVKYVDPKYWKDRLVHVEAGG